MRIAEETGADAISHGATGKGNDRVRFELNAYALNPHIQIIAPWREWDLTPERLVAYAKEHGIPVETRKDGGADYSMDANMLHIPTKGELEDPWVAPDDAMWRWTVLLQEAPDTPESVELTFSG